MSTAATPEQILDAYAVHGNDIIVIDWEENVRHNKEGNTDYHDNKLRLADGTLVAPYLRIIDVEITGCRSPEDRGQNGPRIGVKRQTKGHKNSPVGEAMFLIATAWKYQVEKHRKDPNFFPEGFEAPVIKTFMQSHYGGRNGVPVTPMDDPITYVKFRPKRGRAGAPATNGIDGTIEYFDETTQSKSKYIEGQPITMDNIHMIARPKSKYFGIVGFHQTIKSSQGYSNIQAVRECFLRPSTSGGPEANYDAEELELMGLGPNSNPAPTISLEETMHGLDISNTTPAAAINPDPMAEAEGEVAGEDAA